MKEFLNKFSDRNSLLFDDNTSKTKTLSQKIIDSISWILNDSSSSIDREYLWEYWVFHPEKTLNMSYGMFLEFIKFVKIDDKEAYVNFLKEKAVFFLRWWFENDKVKLKNLEFCLSSWILSKKEFEEAMDYYFIKNKNSIYSFANRCMMATRIEPKHEAVTTIIWAIDEVVPFNYKPKRAFKKEACVSFIKNISIHKSTHITQKQYYIDELYEQLKNWNFDFYSEIILLFSTEESD